MLAPPITTPDLISVYADRSCTIERHCWASSRVGRTIRARVTDKRLLRSKRRWRIGKANAAVFPEPVIALIRISFPWSTAGTALSCTFVGPEKPRLLQALSKGRAKFNFEKLSSDTFSEGRVTATFSLTFYFLLGAGAVDVLSLSSTAELPKDQDGAACSESSRSEKKFLARLLISI